MHSTRPVESDAAPQVLSLVGETNVLPCDARFTRHTVEDAAFKAGFLSLISDHAADLISIQHAGGRYLYVSENSLRLFGWRAEQLLGRLMVELVHPDYLATLEACSALHASGRPSRAIYRMLHACGRYRWVENRSRATADGRYVVSVVRDVHSKARLLMKLRREAYSDSLTGLHNRRSLAGLLGTELQRSRRTSCSLAVAFIDCDRFKTVNDLQGHRAGDEMLRAVGRCILEAKRTYDIAGRWGGDEFLLLLPEASAAEAALAANRIRELLGGILPELTLSIGISSNEHGDSKEDLLLQADIALYEAKRLGGNRVVLWTADCTREGYGSLGA